MNITELRLSTLIPDPDNIRDDAYDEIAALAADIRGRGLQTPLHVYPHPHADGMYQIWAGHRRWAALCVNGANTAGCIVKAPPASVVDKLDGMVSENLHRRQLNPIEEAKVYRRYIDAGLPQGDIATRCGVAPSKVSMYLKLLEELSPDEQAKVARGEISANRALKTVRERRMSSGKARADAGRAHAMTVWTPHFNTNHQLHQVAASHCQAGIHDPADRLGGACGPCWEWAIRRDERAAAQLDGVDVGVPMQAVEVGVLSCSRCRKPYSSEEKHRQCIVVDKAAQKRYVLPGHQWVHAKDRSAQPDRTVQSA